MKIKRTVAAVVFYTAASAFWLAMVALGIAAPVRAWSGDMTANLCGLAFGVVCGAVLLSGVAIFEWALRNR